MGSPISNALRARRVAELAGEVRASTPSRFRTERGGSVYAVHPDGTTTRTKAASLGHDDAGGKEQSVRTVYVDKQSADVLGQMYAAGAPAGKETTVNVDPDGTVVMVQWYGKGPNGEPYGRRIERKFTSQAAPAVGLHPLEFMGRSRHLGSPILDME
jgi:hypothetical protein